MSEFKQFSFLSADSKTMINVTGFIPQGEVAGCVQIAHGINEYGFRYKDFMCFLAENGYAVFANDHLGHGKSIAGEEDRGYFADKDGWFTVVADMKTLRDIIKKEYPDKKIILFGHSMGSFLSRTYLIKYPDDFDAAIICGTGQQNSVLVAAGEVLANTESGRKGRRHHSRRLNDTIFGGYNKRIAYPKTEFDWLSRNEKNVEDYINDPLCGGIPTVGLLEDMMSGIKFVKKSENIEKMNKDIPVLFIAGQDDPVGDYGKGVKRAYEKFKKAGIKDLSISLYKHDRHELLNEVDKDIVYKDIIDWINTHK